MTVERMAVVLHHSQLSGAAKLILVGIANHEGDGGAWPSIETLATYGNCSERTVQRCIKEAVEAGELEVHINDGGTHHTRPDKRPNRYVIRVSCPPECDGTVNHRQAFTAPSEATQRGDSGDTPSDERGDAHDTPQRGDTTERGDTGVASGVTPVSPEPVLEPEEPPVVPHGGTTPTVAEFAEQHGMALTPQQILVANYERFWAAYPRKEGRGTGARAFAEAIASGADPEQIIEGAKRYAADPNRDPQYTKSPTRWLRSQGWLDDPQPGPNGQAAQPTPVPARYTADVLDLPTTPTPMPDHIRAAIAR